MKELELIERLEELTEIPPLYYIYIEKNPFSVALAGNWLNYHPPIRNNQLIEKNKT